MDLEILVAWGSRSLFIRLFVWIPLGLREYGRYASLVYYETDFQVTKIDK